ncbi:MAG: helix-turn-helix domain-containing protein [Actinomycetota bacterium]|nr:helix-turn-helix domain-containing protein [Actinomycetota bacterium]
MTTQTGEQLGRAQHRVRAVAPVPDRASATAVEPVPRIALTQQEACAALGCSEEFFVEHVRPHLRVVRRGRKRLFPVAELRRAVDEMAENVL